ncbi:HemY protein [Ectothiorhodosinus mongolicus]|uniref:HemY protein n=1 Tax=Ectothiorhodosinus mongolicus TaxID=233100 RepID=A0A1R3VWR4_9GAMM|nr:heme biosynthesis HemY N-terminal domain-containing protein [Ectothiorhodosinus mongolicus]ULX57029.1 heme biosynthesis protein HemY [Ectothiorhodosinus mongolicus]SIT69542.1 HemY protein [Ectothiorhodosinus mongolicus]
MKTLITLFIALIATAVIALALLDEPGYVLFAYQDLSVETSLIFFLLSAILVILLCYFAIRLLVGITGLPSRLRQRREQKQAVICQQGLVDGLIEMLEGRWARAEKVLVHTARRGNQPLLNYLEAARAAQYQGMFERRDEYLKEAAKSQPEAFLPVALTQAELQLDHAEYDEAAQTLAELEEKAAGHPQLLRLQARLDRATGNYEHMFKSLPQFRKSGVFAQDTLEEFACEAFTSLAKEAGESGEMAEMEGAWAKLPKSARWDVAYAKPYVMALLQQEQVDRAESVLRDALKNRWDTSLIRLYGRLPLSDSNAALATCERWLRSRPDDPELLLSLAFLASRVSAWDKARRYAQSAIKLTPTAEAYGLLTQIHENSGAHEEALAAGKEWHELTLRESGAVG